MDALVEMNGLTDANGPILRATGSVMSYDTMLDDTTAPVPAGRASRVDPIVTLKTE